MSFDGSPASNSIPLLFVFSKMRHRGSHFLLRPPRRAHWCLLEKPNNALVLFGFEAVTAVFGIKGSALRPAVCLSASEGGRVPPNDHEGLGIWILPLFPEVLEGATSRTCFLMDAFTVSSRGRTPCMGVHPPARRQTRRYLATGLIFFVL